MESAHNYADAIILYLNDATESIKRGLLVRAGLSCSCVADCLVKFGVESLQKKVYFMAATIYRENANSARHRSIREWLWSLQKACENFLLAGEQSMAEAIHNEYMILAKRAQPFIVDAEMPVSKFHSTSSAIQSVLTMPESVANAVNIFLEQEIVHLKHGIEMATGNKNRCKE